MAIELISGIKPKNGGKFPLVDAEDVLMPGGERLPDHTHAWDNLNNRPFYSVFHSSEGTFADAPGVAFDALAGTMCTAHKVSALIPTTEEILRMSVGIQSDAGMVSCIPVESEILINTDDVTVFQLSGTPAYTFAAVRTAGEIQYEVDGISMTVVPPETGIYYLIEYGSEWSAMSFSFSYTEVKKLDAVYLPDGVATEKYVDEKLAQIDISGGSSEMVILEEQVFAGFVYNETFGYMLNVNPSPFTATVGGVYRVEWDGVSYEVTAEDASAFSEGTILLGNGEMVGLSGNDEPFAIGWSSTGVSCFAFEDSAESHTIAIYQIGGSDNGLPAVTASDNGKILQVVNGAWAAVEMLDVSEVGL